MGHEAYLMQVLSNLIYNGVKFVAPDRQPSIRIWTESADSEVRIFVQDNGIGIPREAQGRMFRMFERFHAERSHEGTGIGLAIVRKAVERNPSPAKAAPSGCNCAGRDPSSLKLC